MSDQARSQHASNVIDAYQRQVDRGVNPREAHHKVMTDVTAKANPSTRVEAQRIADRAIKSYAEKLVDRSPGDAKAGAIRDAVRPQDVGLDVKNYTRTVLNSVEKSSNPGRVALTHAASAADAGRASLHDAARVAQVAMRQYGSLRQRGADHLSAREEVAKSMDDRFDSRGRDAHRSKSMSL